MAGRLVAATWLVLAVGLVTGCGDGGGGVAGSPCELNGVTATIFHNHPNGPHRLEVPVGDVREGVPVAYDIQGDNTGHGHTVTVSAGDFAALAQGTPVALVSSDTGAAGRDHAHPVGLTCAP